MPRKSLIQSIKEIKEHLNGDSSAVEISNISPSEKVFLRIKNDEMQRIKNFQKINGHENQSQAIRQLVRKGLEAEGIN